MGGDVKVSFLSTDEFWDKMCDPRFMRVSLRQGALTSKTIQNNQIVSC